MNEYHINGKIVGFMNQDKTYVSRRVAKTHFYIKGRGYPISNALLRQLDSDDCKKIRIVELRSDGSIKKYECSLDKYMAAVLIQEGGFEQQRVVPLSEMEVVDGSC